LEEQTDDPCQARPIERKRTRITIKRGEGQFRNPRCPLAPVVIINKKEQKISTTQTGAGSSPSVGGAARGYKREKNGREEMGVQKKRNS